MTKKIISTWQEAVETISPHIVKIETPHGAGTGFLCTYSHKNNLCCIATAAHVVRESFDWEEIIRLQHYDSGKTISLRVSERAILINEKLDTAAIVFDKGASPLPPNPLGFIDRGSRMRVGVEIGWIGFPSVSPKNLCFFTGRISCWINELKYYLVDGVAINGVSGGPAFHIEKNECQILGSVSAYLPNRVGATPGLAVISDVEQFLKVIKDMKNLDEAKEKETPLNESKKEEPQTSESKQENPAKPNKTN